MPFSLFKRKKPKAEKEEAPATRGYSGKQKYTQIIAECKKTGKLWEDPEFPADDLSLFPNQKLPQSPHWARPSEVSPDAELFVGGGSRFDVQQGALGDCWLLAAVASLSLHENLLHEVIPLDQDFSTGCVKFRFWQYGDWKEVLVDDRLPIRYTRDKEDPKKINKELIFMHSAEKNEFWSALLEKAYAKLNGSYENLKGGQTSEAMEDFTGGVTEVFKLDKPRDDLFNIMYKANKRQSLMGCSVNAKPGVVEAKGELGLIMGHAYSITDIAKAHLKAGEHVHLIRIRNPWGNECEWQGAWCDSSDEWNKLEDEDKNRLMKKDDDGEFWMCYDDFVKYFSKLEMCALGPDSAPNVDPKGKKITWECNKEQLSWVKSHSAGGCRNNPDTFWTNPQMCINVIDPDEDDDLNTSTIIVSLMQKDRRKTRQQGAGGGMRTIGFAIYQVPEGTTLPKPIPKNFFLSNKMFAKSSSFINSRGLCDRFKVPPGQYVVVASTFKPNEDAGFLLRIFSEKAHESVPMDEECGMSEVENEKQTEHHQKTTEELARAEQIKNVFLQVAGEDEDMDAAELRKLLTSVFNQRGQVKFDFDGFSQETCRSMVSLLDVDESGKLGCEEFTELWELLCLWKAAFQKSDQDKSGKLQSIELRYALKAVGMTLSNEALKSCVLRYATRDGEIEFDDYILLCCRLRTCFETINAMKESSGSSSGAIAFDKDLFIKTCIYL